MTSKEALIVLSSKSPNQMLVASIAAWKQFHPKVDICVIDSDSTDTSVYDALSHRDDIHIHFAKNHNYELGAWKCAMDLHPHYQYYLLSQDSLAPTQSLNWRQVSTFHHHSGFLHHPSLAPLARALLKTTRDLPNQSLVQNFNLAQHCSMIVPNAMLRDILHTFPVLPQNKNESCCFERLLGMYFIIKQIPTTDLATMVSKKHGGRN